MVMVKKGGVTGLFSVSLSLVVLDAYSSEYLGTTLLSCGQCSETALNRSRRGAFRSSCGAVRCVWMTSISNVKGMQTDGMFTCKVPGPRSFGGDEPSNEEVVC